MREQPADLAGSYGEWLMAMTGLSGGTVVENSPLPGPIVIHEHCDVDQACDRAKYEVFVGGSNLFEGGRKLYFCGHHFHQYEQALIERGYRVRKI